MDRLPRGTFGDTKLKVGDSYIQKSGYGKNKPIINSKENKSCTRKER